MILRKLLIHIWTIIIIDFQIPNNVYWIYLYAGKLPLLISDLLSDACWTVCLSFDHLKPVAITSLFSDTVIPIRNLDQVLRLQQPFHTFVKDVDKEWHLSMKWQSVFKTGHNSSRRSLIFSKPSISLLLCPFWLQDKNFRQFLIPRFHISEIGSEVGSWKRPWGQNLGSV